MGWQGAEDEVGESSRPRRGESALQGGRRLASASNGRPGPPGAHTLVPWTPLRIRRPSCKPLASLILAGSATVGKASVVEIARPILADRAPSKVRAAAERRATRRVVDLVAQHRVRTSRRFGSQSRTSRIKILTCLAQTS